MNFINQTTNKQKVPNFLLILGRSWKVKTALKLSSKYLKQKIDKIKQQLTYILAIINQDIPAIPRTFLNLNKKLFKTLNQQKQPSEVFLKAIVCKMFVNFKGKHLFQSLLLNKFAAVRSTIVLRKRLWYRCFFVKKHSQLLLLHFLAKS